MTVSLPSMIVPPRMGNLGSPSLQSQIKISKVTPEMFETIPVGSPSLPSKIKTTLDDFVTPTYKSYKTHKLDLSSYLSPIDLNTNVGGGSPSLMSSIKPKGLEGILSQMEKPILGSPSLSSYIPKYDFSSLEKIEIGSPSLPSKINTSLDSLLIKNDESLDWKPYKPKVKKFDSYLTNLDFGEKNKSVNLGSPSLLSKIAYGLTSLLDKPKNKINNSFPSLDSYLTIKPFSVLDKSESKESSSFMFIPNPISFREKKEKKPFDITSSFTPSYKNFLDKKDENIFTPAFLKKEKEPLFNSTNILKKYMLKEEEKDDSLFSFSFEKKKEKEPAYVNFFKEEKKFLNFDVTNFREKRKEKPFSYSNILFKKEDDKEPLNFDVTSFGKKQYDTLPKTSFFRKENLLPEVKKMKKKFEIPNYLLKGVNLFDRKKTEFGMGAGYNFKENSLNFNPEPLKNFTSKKYEKITKDNFLPHEFGHMKVMQKYGNPMEQITKISDLPYIKPTHEHIADMIANQNSNTFGITQRNLMEDENKSKWSIDKYPKELIDLEILEDKKEKQKNDYIGGISYRKVQSREFGLPEVERELTYNFAEDLLKRSKYNFNKVSSYMDKIEDTTDKIQEIGLMGTSGKKVGFLSKIKTVRNTLKKLNKDYIHNFWEKIK